MALIPRDDLQRIDSPDHDSDSWQIPRRNFRRPDHRRGAYVISRPISRPISRSISRAIAGSGDADGPAFTDDEQDASLFLDFTRQLYGVQTADEASANSLRPRPSLYLDFSSNKYFMGEK